MSENNVATTAELVAQNMRRKDQNRRLASELADIKRQLTEAQTKHAAEISERDSAISQYQKALSGQVEILKELGLETLDDLIEDYVGIAEQFNAIGNDPQYQALTKQIEDLQGTIRTSKHQAVFDEKAKSLGFNPDALADVWEMSGYKAESDDIDESAMDAALNDLKGRKSWLLKPAETAPSPGTTGAAVSSTGKHPNAQGTGGAIAAEVAPVGAKTLTLNATNPGAGAGRGTPEPTGAKLVSVKDRVDAAFAATGRTDAFKL